MHSKSPINIMLFPSDKSFKPAPTTMTGVSLRPDEVWEESLVLRGRDL